MKFEYFIGKQTNYKIIFHKFEKYEKNANNIGYKRLNRIKTHDSMIKTNYHIKIIFFVFSLNFAHFDIDISIENRIVTNRDFRKWCYFLKNHDFFDNISDFSFFEMIFL